MWHLWAPKIPFGGIISCFWQKPEVAFKHFQKALFADYCTVFVGVLEWLLIDTKTPPWICIDSVSYIVGLGVGIRIWCVDLQYLQDAVLLRNAS